MKKLPTHSGGEEGLGLATIMDAAIAQQHGVPYVHLAAFAIDVDRVRVELEEDETLPFGWEVFLTEHYLLSQFDPIRKPEELVLFEDIIVSVLEGGGDALGAQIVFAMYDAMKREKLPARLEPAFDRWKEGPDELVEELKELWARETELVEMLAKRVLECKMEPPFAPPAEEALKALAAA